VGPADEFSMSQERLVLRTRTSCSLYRVTLHSAIEMSHHEAWYGERDLTVDVRIWECRVLVPNHDIKKIDNCAALAAFMDMPGLVLSFDGLIHLWMM
jgi:hypothetical protein